MVDDEYLAADEDIPADETTQHALAKATRGAMISAVLIMLSRLSGVLRESVVAAVFGLTDAAGAYQVALQLPDTLFYLIAGGALSSSFMPLYASYRREKGEAAAWELASVVLTLWTALVIAMVIVFEVAAGPLTRWLATPGVGQPGSEWSWAEYDLVVRMTRIILPAQIAFFSGGLLMGLQWVRHEFVIPGVGPIIYNLGIMAGGLIGGWQLGADQGVLGLAWGALLGAVLGNLVLQVIGVLRYRPVLRLNFNWRHRGAQRVFLLMLPVIFSLSMPIVDTQINRWFASRYCGGDIVQALNLANRLMLLPIGVFGTAVATSFYASMTNLAAAGELDTLRRTLILGLKQVAVAALPATALFIVLRVEAVAMLYERGAFTRADTLVVAAALAWYAIGIYAWCAEQLLGRAFYALGDTRTPPWTGTAVTVLFIAMNYGFMHWFAWRLGPGASYLGLAASTSVAAIIYCLALSFLLRRRLGRLGGGELLSSLMRTLLATGALAITAYLTKLTLVGSGLSSVWLVGLTSGLAGCLVFGLCARWLGLEEAAAVGAKIRAMVRRAGRH